MDPNGLHILAKRGRQSTDHLGVLIRFHRCHVSPAELGIHLNLGSQTIVEVGAEQVGVYRDPSVNPSVEHRSRTLSGERQVLERGRVRGRDDVRVDEDRAPEWR